MMLHVRPALLIRTGATSFLGTFLAATTTLLPRFSRFRLASSPAAATGFSTGTTTTSAPTLLLGATTPHVSTPLASFAPRATIIPTVSSGSTAAKVTPISCTDVPPVTPVVTTHSGSAPFAIAHRWPVAPPDRSTIVAIATILAISAPHRSPISGTNPRTRSVVLVVVSTTPAPLALAAGSSCRLALIGTTAWWPIGSTRSSSATLAEAARRLPHSVLLGSGSGGGRCAGRFWCRFTRFAHVSPVGFGFGGGFGGCGSFAASSPSATSTAFLLFTPRGTFLEAFLFLCEFALDFLLLGALLLHNRSLFLVFNATLFGASFTLDAFLFFADLARFFLDATTFLFLFAQPLLTTFLATLDDTFG